MWFLTKWQEFRDRGREEHKFHCDLILLSGEQIVIQARRADGTVARETCIEGGPVTKVHIAASWEHRDTLDAEAQG